MVKSTDWVFGFEYCNESSIMMYLSCLEFGENFNKFYRALKRIGKSRFLVMV